MPRAASTSATRRQSAAGKLLKHELRAPYWKDRERKVN
jgi:hypothetical protein